jgi:hypothetical protein
VISEDGRRVFFDSSDRLVLADSNAKQDVYEWEEDGTGSCHNTGGCVYLVSGGTSDEDASFVDASANGSDVFFITRQQLVSGDTDRLFDLYDARAPHIEGEHVGALEPAASASCESESCRPSIAMPPVFGQPLSMLFVSPENVAISTAVVKSSHSNARKTRGAKSKHHKRHAKRTRHKKKTVHASKTDRRAK